MHKDQAGLYIHVPFCLSKCGYCSFYSVASPALIPEFVKAVSREMAFYKKSFQSFDTIYLGGGTPSLLSIQQIDDILKSANDHFNIDRQTEITVEVNPGDGSAEYFQQLRKRGINRLNIGIQSFNDSLLKFLGRRHSAKEAGAAMDAARQAGFDNIGIDLIYGVYGQDMKTWKETLSKALSFLPEHLSCYQLSLDEKTPLYEQYGKESLQLPAENEALDFFMTTSKILTDAGYIHYEVSNFARSEALCSRHNMKYWRHIPYLGLGPAAHSFCDRRRWWNKADVNAYIRIIFEGKTPVLQSEELSAEQLALEALFLGLRTKDGIDLDEYQIRYGVDLLTQKKQILRKLEEDKLVEIKDGCLRPTLSGMAVADSLALI
ncbi:MAG TPA: coproporphyrinogen III oxidase [Syntrophaceae bacterium]|jgi:oxygen-independent coproporphyrinogen-3 oxidase|nr:coproporphyrinogen III oxidase [Syntrophaceae bacterium]